MATAPQDRKPKKGYARIGDKDFKVRENLDDDWGFAEMSAAAQSGSNQAGVRIVQYALNDDDEAYEALKEYCTVDGRVSAKRMQEELRKIIEATAPNS